MKISKVDKHFASEKSFASNFALEISFGSKAMKSHWFLEIS